MRVVVLSLALGLAPLADAANSTRRNVIDQVPISVDVVGESQLEAPGDLDVQFALPNANTVFMGTTRDGARITLRGIDGTPNLTGLRNGQLAAAYVPASGGRRPTLLLGGLPQIERIEVLRGPQGALYGQDAVAGVIRLGTVSRIDGCAGIEFDLNLDAETLTASPGWCDEPYVMKIDCPTVASVGETVQFDAVVSESVNAQIDWALSPGLTLSAEYRDYRDPDIDWGEIVGTSHKFDTPGSVDVSVTASNAFGTDTFTCPVEVQEGVEASRAGDTANIGLRFGIGRDEEFKAVFGTVAFTSPIPVGMPLFGDVSVRAFSSGMRDYIGLNVEALCRTELADLGDLFWGGGLHALRQSSPGNSDLELGLGVSARFEYDAGLPVQPTVGLSLSRLYGTFIPQATVGATFWW